MFVFHFAIIQNYKDTFQANNKKKKENEQLKDFFMRIYGTNKMLHFKYACKWN